MTREEWDLEYYRRIGTWLAFKLRDPHKLTGIGLNGKPQDVTDPFEPIAGAPTFMNVERT